MIITLFDEGRILSAILYWILCKNGNMANADCALDVR